ncbi:uncharacterized protein CEXT_557261 [Caerostris extrusa]|uniref:Cyclin-dependent kinase inhibitor domain-containing protein n=1 Tax=Caerostris extrusa TaxID=172846 RepID=A0AAV4P017_CAEEX|nr:uncharacterized protein CEXT_557261 [Caerostris extrusa]
MGDAAAVGILRPDPGPGLLWVPNPIRARRCLFGPPDHGTTENFLESQTKILEERNKERWNFDFIRGAPLRGGRFAWTPVKKGERKDGDGDSSSSEKDGDGDGGGDSGSCTAQTKASQTLITGMCCEL